MLESLACDFSGLFDFHFRSPVSGTFCPLHSERGGKDPKQENGSKAKNQAGLRGPHVRVPQPSVVRGVLAQAGGIGTKRWRASVCAWEFAIDTRLSSESLEYPTATGVLYSKEATASTCRSRETDSYGISRHDKNATLPWPSGRRISAWS